MIKTCSWLSLRVNPLLACWCYITKVDKPQVATQNPWRNNSTGDEMKDQTEFIETWVRLLMGFYNFNLEFWLAFTGSQIRQASIEMS